MVGGTESGGGRSRRGGRGGGGELLRGGRRGASGACLTRHSAVGDVREERRHERRARGGKGGGGGRAGSRDDTPGDGVVGRLDILLMTSALCGGDETVEEAGVGGVSTRGVSPAGVTLSSTGWRVDLSDGRGCGTLERRGLMPGDFRGRSGHFLGSFGRVRQFLGSTVRERVYR